MTTARFVVKNMRLDVPRESACCRERHRDLIIQLMSIDDDDEGPIAAKLAQHLLGEEGHREGSFRSLGCARRYPCRRI
jgi:hypothetical protein